MESPINQMLKNQKAIIEAFDNLMHALTGLLWLTLINGVVSLMTVCAFVYMFGGG